MKRIALVVLVLALALSMSGCVTGMGGSNATAGRTITTLKPDGTTITDKVDEFTDTMAYHENIRLYQEAEQKRIAAQATAVSQIDTEGLSKDAKAILAMQQMSLISGLQPTQYSGKAPKTWIDVGDTVAGFVPDIVKGTIAYKGMQVLGQAVESAGDKFSVNAEGGSSISGSSKVDTKQTANTESMHDAVSQFQPASSSNPSGSLTSEQPLPAMDDTIIVE